LACAQVLVLVLALRAQRRQQMPLRLLVHNHLELLVLNL
jgi:hypothetical protein